MGDPELHLGLPRDLTISTALDALSQALESLWNINADPVSRGRNFIGTRERFESSSDGPVAAAAR